LRAFRGRKAAICKQTCRPRPPAGTARSLFEPLAPPLAPGRGPAPAAGSRTCPFR
jgi:hypothetical protein